MKNPIPERLKVARKKLNLSQKKLGIKIGIDESSASGRMNHYEKGRNVPEIETLHRLANVLNVPFLYFFCQDEVTAELICSIEKLSADQKKALSMALEDGDITL